MRRGARSWAALVAAATLGGTVGALASAATQSQASPQAIAAAVQHVSDVKAQQQLAVANQKLATISTSMQSLLTQLSTNQTGVSPSAYRLLLIMCEDLEKSTGASGTVNCFG